MSSGVVSLSLPRKSILNSGGKGTEVTVFHIFTSPHSSQNGVEIFLNTSGGFPLIGCGSGARAKVLYISVFFL